MPLYTAARMTVATASQSQNKTVMSDEWAPFHARHSSLVTHHLSLGLGMKSLLQPVEEGFFVAGGDLEADHFAGGAEFHLARGTIVLIGRAVWIRWNLL
jgi:hypothetical protein